MKHPDDSQHKSTGQDWSQDPEFTELWELLDPPQSSFNVNRGWANLEKNLFPKKNHFKWMVPLMAAAAVWLIYTFAFTHSWQSREVGPLEQAQLSLLDGSKVSLDAQSQISWPESFQKVRHVKLAGRAFFDVESDPKPFVVETDRAKIEVLGTQFEVWTTNDLTRVWVLEGKVKVSDQHNTVYLEAGQLVRLGPDQKGIKEMADPEPVRAWMRGELLFEQAPLNEVIHILQQTFGVNIKLDGSIDVNRTFTGQFKRENLPSILEEVCLSFNYELIEEVDGYRLEK